MGMQLGFGKERLACMLLLWMLHSSNGIHDVKPVGEFIIGGC